MGSVDGGAQYLWYFSSTRDPTESILTFEWDEKKRLASNLDTYYSYAHIKLDNDNNPHIIHAQYTSPIITHHWKEDGTWHKETIDISELGDTVGCPNKRGIQFCINQYNTLDLVFYVHSYFGFYLYHMSKTGDIWSEPYQLADWSDIVYVDPAVFIDHDPFGIPHIMWPAAAYYEHPLTVWHKWLTYGGWQSESMTGWYTPYPCGMACSKSSTEIYFTALHQYRIPPRYEVCYTPFLYKRSVGGTWSGIQTTDYDINYCRSRGTLAMIAGSPILHIPNYKKSQDLPFNNTAFWENYLAYTYANNMSEHQMFDGIEEPGWPEPQVSGNIHYDTVSVSTTPYLPEHPNSTYFSFMPIEGRVFMIYYSIDLGRYYPREVVSDASCQSLDTEIGKQHMALITGSRSYG